MSSHLHTVRRLLGEAAEEAALLGEEPRREPPGVGYFADAKGGGLDKAIQAIARHDGDVTLFVGAGVSTEAQLPSWTELVRALLNGAGDDLDGEDRETWINATLAEGPLAAAAIARALRSDAAAFRQALRQALYGGRRPADFAPGALAQQIAWLKCKLGPRLRIATANYDGLLEAALEEAGLDVVSHVSKRAEPQDWAAVWHLHGRLMRNDADTGWRREGELVLTEGDYARSTHAKWPEEFVAECLRESLCVFLGLSMTDPNFIRWLYRHGSGSPFEHIAVFVRQAAPVTRDIVREKLEQSAAARWRMARVKPVWTNYYGEVAQFVHEVGLSATDGAEGFSTRAAARLATARRNLMPAGQKGFERAQHDLSRWLRSRLKAIRRLGSTFGVDLDREDLGLGLWVVDHASGVAELWGTSEQVWLDRKAIEGRPVHVATRWVGVAAVTHGISVEQDPAVYTTRWRFIRGAPIVVEPRGARSIVGATTLTSATKLDSCPLSVAKSPPGLLSAVDALLAQSAPEFFID